MKDIKTKPISKAPKTPDASARLPRTAKAMLLKTKDGAKETDARDEHSPESYATNRTYRGVWDTAYSGVKIIRRTVKWLVQEKGKLHQDVAYKETSEGIAVREEKPYPDYMDYDMERSGDKGSRPSTESRRTGNLAVKSPTPPDTVKLNSKIVHQTSTRLVNQNVPFASQPGYRSYVPSPKVIKHNAWSTPRTADKGIKNIQKSIKASERTIKMSVQAAKVTAKSVKATVKTARISAQAVRNAARATVKGVRLLLKVTIAAAKAAALAYKSIVAAIAAGGWVVMLIVLVVGALSMLLSSAFGIFYSNEPASASAITMSQVVSGINSDFEAYVSSRAAKASDGHSNVSIVYDGDSDGDSNSVNNWVDVLGVYAVKTTMDVAAPANVAILTEDKAKAFHDLFFEMNTVSTRTEIKTETKTAMDEDGTVHEETVEKTYVYVTVSSIDSQDAVAKYHFSAEQNKMLDELLSPENYPLFAEITGVDVYGGIPPEDIRKIIRNLPAGTKGATIVQAALTRLGDPYSMAKRGQGRYVDCSYFVRWAYNQAGEDNYKAATAAEQARYCVTHNAIISKDQLQPGDVVFWRKNGCTCAGDHCGRYMGIHHVAIYIGDGKLIEASSSKGRVVIRNIWGEGPGKWQIILYARPHVIN